MPRVTVTDTRDGSIQRLEVSPDRPLVIGRVEGNDLILNHSKVSRRHAEISLEDGYFKIKDMGSANGTYLNNLRIEKDQEKVVFGEDKIRIADFMITVEPDSAPSPPPKLPTPETPPSVPARPEAVDTILKPPTVAKPAPPSTPVKEFSFSEDADEGAANGLLKAKLTDQDLKKLEILFQLKRTIHDRLIQYLDLKKLDFNKLKEVELRDRTLKVIKEIFGELGEDIPRWADKKRLAKEVLDEVLGLGPLEDFLTDDSITEIMVNGKDQVFIERAGKLQETTVRFSSDHAVMAIIERIVAPIGRRIDESSPMVDARLKDGSRVNAIIPPLALKGPSVTIRKFSKDPFTIEDLIAFDSLTESMAQFLKVCVVSRKNIVVSGGTGSGKTTLLNVISSFLPESERILTIENVSELQLRQTHWVALESRPANLEGRGAISVRDLVVNSLRMRPDRIVVGECRGGETIDMIQAMNTGHDGSLTTLHANNPLDALRRMETMSLMAGLDLPSRAIREQISAAVDLVVHTRRFPDGMRRVEFISEVAKGLDEQLNMKVTHIFAFRQESVDSQARVIGRYHATGYKPTFLSEMSAKGLALPPNFFNPD